MLESLLPWAYLWPAVVLVCVGVVAWVVAANLVVGAVLLSVYSMIPKDVVDRFLDWLVVGSRQKFAHYFQKVEDHLRETFPVHGAKTLPSSCLLLWHPHSLLAVTAVLHTVFRITPDLASSVVCHSIYHRIPVISDIVRYGGGIPADYAVMKDALTKGDRVSVLLGGVREMMETSEKTIQLVLRNRTGVFRLALQTGTPLVPVLSYGESEMFPAWSHPVLKFVNQILYSAFHIAIPVTSWDALSNWVTLYWNPLTPIPTHVGDPVVVEKIESPTDEDIRTLRETYIARLKELFDETHPPGYTLVIQE